MNKYIKQWCFAVFMLSLSSVALAAPKGICTPDNGVFHSTLDFSGYLITANENKVGTTFNTTVTKEGANKWGNSSRLTQSFHFFMFEPIFSPVNALNQPI